MNKEDFDLDEFNKQLIEDIEHQEHIKDIKSNSMQENIQYIRQRIKKIRLTVHPDFEKWLNEEKDKTVLFYLTLLMSIKMYNRSRHYVRYRLLWEHELWDIWRKSTPSV